MAANHRTLSFFRSISPISSAFLAFFSAALDLFFVLFFFPPSVVPCFLPFRCHSFFFCSSVLLIWSFKTFDVLTSLFLPCPFLFHSFFLSFLSSYILADLAEEPLAALVFTQMIPRRRCCWGSGKSRATKACNFCKGHA